jgi:hypothetical protein
MTIAQKRATLYREWILATLGNHENYYYSTIVCGIPDGDDEQTVMEDLKDGFYDDDIDFTIEVYTRAKARYAKHGYFINRQVGTVTTEEEAIKAYESITGKTLPERIYKR